MVRTNAFETLMRSAPPVDPLRFDINSYLSKLDAKNGKCRVCGNKVPWNRDRVTSHKTSRNCVGQSDDEANLFGSLKRMKANAKVAMTVGTKRPAESIPLSERQHPAVQREALRLQPATSFVDSVTVGEAARIDAALANLVFRTGMSFRIIDSQAMKDFVRALRPAYADRMPSARSIAGKYLNSAHSELMERVLNAVNTAKWFSVNASNMRGAWEIIEAKYPTIFANGCSAHVLNLLIKEVCGLTEFSDLLKESGRFRKRPLCRRGGALRGLETEHIPVGGDHEDDENDNTVECWL